MSKAVARLFWKPEMDELLQEFVPGHTEREIIDEFERKFDIRLRVPQLKNRMTTLGLKQGVNSGHFKKGQSPFNKGMKQTDYMSAESIERTKATRFHNGNIPHNAKGHEIGRERISADGYTEVKVKLHYNSGNFVGTYRGKHVLIWERTHGRHIPDKTAVLFADGNKRNFDPDNLVAVPRKLLVVINHCNIPYFDRQSLEAAIKIAEIKIKSNELELSEPRICKECGAQFVPEFKTQARCRKCIDERKEI